MIFIEYGDVKVPFIQFKAQPLLNFNYLLPLKVGVHWYVYLLVCKKFKLEFTWSIVPFIRHWLGQHQRDSPSLSAPCPNRLGPKKAAGKGGPHQSNSTGFRHRSPGISLWGPMDNAVLVHSGSKYMTTGFRTGQKNMPVRGNPVKRYVLSFNQGQSWLSVIAPQTVV